MISKSIGGVLLCLLISQISFSQSKVYKGDGKTELVFSIKDKKIFKGSGSVTALYQLKENKIVKGFNSEPVFSFNNDVFYNVGKKSNITYRIEDGILYSGVAGENSLFKIFNGKVYDVNNKKVVLYTLEGTFTQAELMLFYLASGLIQ
jgi:hypothetical protein